MSARVASFARQTVTVLRAQVVLDHGNEVTDWTAPASWLVAGCIVAPHPGTEDDINRAGTVAPWLLVAPAGTDIAAADRVQYGGRTLEVVGQPRAWQSGIVDHVEADLQEISG